MIIYDLLGKEVLRKNWETPVNQLNHAGLNNGFYVVGVQLGGKIIKKKSYSRR